MDRKENKPAPDQPGRPDQGLPGRGGPGRPDQGLPARPGGGPRPDNTLPGTEPPVEPTEPPVEPTEPVDPTAPTQQPS